MKKLIIKTAIITTLSVICFALIVYGALSIFSPKTLANFYNGLGNYSLTEKYYEKQYNKTKDIDDLYILCSLIDEGKGEGKEYFATFFDKENVEDYCNTQDEKTISKISTYDYLAGKYAVICFLGDGIEEATSVSLNLVQNGYTIYNPFRAIIEYKDKMSSSDIEYLKNSLIQLKEELTGSEKIIAQNDINELIG